VNVLQEDTAVYCLLRAVVEAKLSRLAQVSKRSSLKTEGSEEKEAVESTSQSCEEVRETKFSERLRKEEEILRISYLEETKSAQLTDRPPHVKANKQPIRRQSVTPKSSTPVKTTAVSRSKQQANPLSKSLDSSTTLKGLRGSSKRVARPRNITPSKTKTTTPRRSLQTSIEPRPHESLTAMSSNVKPKFKRSQPGPLTERVFSRETPPSKLRISVKQDRSREVSTDRAKLIGDPAKHTQKENSSPALGLAATTPISLPSTCKSVVLEPHQKQLQCKVTELHRKYEDIMNEKRKLMRLLSKIDN
jgi:hypothetical protein